MKYSKLLALLFLLYISVSSYGQNRNIHFEELDRIVELRDYYMQIKEERIDSLVRLGKATSSPEDLYYINNEIYKEYRTYRSDSAWVYVRKNQEIATHLNVSEWQDEVLIAHSYLLSTAGMYQESLENLQTLSPEKLDDKLLLEYYTVCEWSYYVAAAYTNDTDYAPQYQQMEYQYRDSVLTLTGIDSDFYQYYQSKVYMHAGQCKEAIPLLTELYPRLPVNERLYARVTFDLANAYRAIGETDKFEEFMVKAAISDQVCPLKENLAMQLLAIYLYTWYPDDLNRAYRYIHCAMEDARFYNNRLRMVQIAEKLPVIVEAYQQKIEQEKQKITLSLTVISILMLMILISLFYLYRQHQAVRRSRKELYQLNEQLSHLNSQLQYSNRTKEEYVGIFMDLCSSYIEKLNKFRETVKRKIQTGQVDDLYKMTQSTQAIENEVDNFLRNFDRAFLTLFPSFVEEFNSLLTEEGRIHLKKGELLNAELRIFALVRLGIHESSQIATFLRYSPQTIYNYRTRIKNRAGENRDTLEEKVMFIGNHS